MSAAKEKPILFSGPMVRAIIDGRKTLTRRPIKPQPVHAQVHEWKGRTVHDSSSRTWCWKGFVQPDTWTEPTSALGHLSPFGPPGTLLWVRETYCETDWKPGKTGLPVSPLGFIAAYRADYGDIGKPWQFRWRPSIHMPRWASRISLRVKRVWVERVQEISEEDARAEGMIKEFLPNDPDNFHPPYSYGYIFGSNARCIHPTAAEAFSDLWNSTYPGSWDANEWVWACEFERVPSAT